MPKKSSSAKVSAAPRGSKLPDFGEKIGGARKDAWSGQLRLADWELLSDSDLAKVARKERIWPSWEFARLLTQVSDEMHGFRLARFRRAIEPQARLFRGMSFRDSCRLYFETLQYVKGWATTFRRPQDWLEAVERLMDGYCIVPKDAKALGAWEGTAEDSKLCEAPCPNGVLDFEELLPLVLGEKALSQLKRKWGKTARRERIAPRSIEQILSELRTQIDTKDKGFLLLVLTGQLCPTQQVWDESPRLYRKIEATQRAFRPLPHAERQILSSWLGYVKPMRLSAERPLIASPRRSGLPPRYARRPDPDQIMSDLGIRGGEFGNWVSGRERPSVMARVYSAFLDLAEVLEIDASMIGLGGRLSVGFGSRGRGGRKAPLAHFEPWSWSIALTRKNSNGTLCHEWAHGLDLWLGARSLPPDIPAGRIHGAMLSWRIFKKVRDMFAHRPWPEDLYDPSHWAPFNLPFEVVRPIVFIAEFLYARPITPDEATRIRTAVEKQFHYHMEHVGPMVAEVLAHPFPIGKIRPYSPIREDQVSEILRAAVEISDVSSHSIEAIARMAAIVKNVTGHLPCKRFLDDQLAWIELVELVRKVESSLHDGTGSFRVEHPWFKLLRSAGAYWAKPEEIFARTVEAYVFQCLENREGQNQFLVSDFCKLPVYPNFQRQPEIRDAIQEFFDAIKTTGLLRQEQPTRPSGNLA
jgi:hypothetical protein